MSESKNYKPAHGGYPGVITPSMSEVEDWVERIAKSFEPCWEFPDVAAYEATDSHGAVWVGTREFLTVDIGFNDRDLRLMTEDLR